VRRRGFLALFLAACGAAGVLSALLVAVAPVAGADTGTTGTTATTAPPTTAPPPTTTASRPSATIPLGVAIAGTLVGGLTPPAAREEVQASFRRPLTILVNKRIFKVTPQQLGASAYVGDAVKRARITRVGATVPLKVKVSRVKVERWLRALAAKWDRAAVDSTLKLRNGAPFLTKDVPGRQLRVLAGRKAIVIALWTHDRTPIRLRFNPVSAAVGRSSFGDVIVIHRGRNVLNLYDGMKLTRTFGVATGQSAYPTPLGRWHIVVKWRNPWWYPPASDWAADAEPIPPGPGNPLGTRWMGLDASAVGIHGTPDPASIGYSASHGCIRMRIPEAEWLFDHVDIGTPVYIIPS
jgi:lipoprotein-anchoring transpeptidase ErfK/SrfK